MKRWDLTQIVQTKKESCHPWEKNSHGSAAFLFEVVMPSLWSELHHWPADWPYQRLRSSGSLSDGDRLHLTFWIWACARQRVSGYDGIDGHLRYIDDAKDTDLFVIATTNDTRYMPPSLLRPGRFDYVIYLQPPIGENAENIVSYYLRNKDLAEDSISPPTKFCMASRVLSSSISFGSSIGRSARTLIFCSSIVYLQIKTGQSKWIVL